MLQCARILKPLCFVLSLIVVSCIFAKITRDSDSLQIFIEPSPSLIDPKNKHNTWQFWFLENYNTWLTLIFFLDEQVNRCLSLFKASFCPISQHFNMLAKRHSSSKDLFALGHNDRVKLEIVLFYWSQNKLCNNRCSAKCKHCCRLEQKRFQHMHSVRDDQNGCETPLLKTV